MQKLLILSLLILTSACSGGHRELKSPCVGIEGSPCVRHPINVGVA